MNAWASGCLMVLALVACTPGCARAATDEGQTSRPSPTEPARAVGGTHNCDAYYPEISRRRNESGDVLVRYDVSADGAITHVAVLKSSGHPALDLAAVECVSMHWQDRPARKNGTAVASPDHRAIIRFRLQGPAAPPFPEGTMAAVLVAAGLAVAGIGVLLSHRVTRGPRVAG